MKPASTLPPSPSPSPSPEVDTTAAFGGLPATIPGTVEAENFDVGGEGIAYSDTDPGNNGGVRALLLFFFYCVRLEGCAVPSCEPNVPT